LAAYIAVAVTGREPAAVASALDGQLPGKVAAVRRHGPTLIVLCEPDTGATLAHVADAVRGVAESTAPNGSPVWVGTAGPKRGPAGAQAAMLEAEQALALGRATRQGDRTTHFDDLGPYRFVLGRPTSELRATCERVLGPLVTDPRRHHDLTLTLEAFLHENGSLNGVARALFLHRNTVRQRLKRIAALTGADLNDPDARLLMQLALLAWRALEYLDDTAPSRRARDPGTAAAD
jgi:sugar diacid utilization regulator